MYNDNNENKKKKIIVISKVISVILILPLQAYCSSLFFSFLSTRHNETPMSLYRKL